MFKYTKYLDGLFKRRCGCGLFVFFVSLLTDDWMHKLVDLNIYLFCQHSQGFRTQAKSQSLTNVISIVQRVILMYRLINSVEVHLVPTKPDLRMCPNMTKQGIIFFIAGLQTIH